MSNIFEELTQRGYTEQLTHPEEIKNLLDNESISFYIGFDPTADSLHVGHFISLMVASHMQKAGHRPIILIGGGTATIGDPSGKTDMRRMMSREEIDHNVECFKKQIAKFLSFEGENAAIIVNNADWLLDLKFISQLRDNLKFMHPEMFYKKLEAKNSPLVENRVPMIKQILKRDILLTYPFESMSPFLRLLEEASRDPSVASIKMTLYRVAKNSKIVKSLIRAAENGKEVVVLVELRARFDEENNIDWSKRLEESGCRVIYGLDGLKVHSKICLITCKNNQGIHYVCQIGTGNYNEVTSKLYTDISLMTSKYEIGEEINTIFNHLSLGETESNTQYLMVAPNCMITKIFEYIDEQIELAKSGKEAYVGFKCNSVTSKRMIDKLIEASQAGVKIDMIVRGICCIIPGVQGYTENIRVISIVGRYLEHSRIYIFGKGDNQKVYISSADLMTRNLARRVEVAAPILDEKIKKRLVSMFNTMLKDNVKACELLSDGSYKRIKNKLPELNSQEYFFK